MPAAAASCATPLGATKQSVQVERRRRRRWALTTARRAVLLCFSVTPLLGCLTCNSQQPNKYGKVNSSSSSSSSDRAAHLGFPCDDEWAARREGALVAASWAPCKPPNSLSLSLSLPYSVAGMIVAPPPPSSSSLRTAARAMENESETAGANQAVGRAQSAARSQLIQVQRSAAIGSHRARYHRRLLGHVCDK